MKGGTTMMNELFKEFLVCPKCGHAITDKKSLESNIERYKESHYCTRCGRNIASTYKEALAVVAKCV